MYVSTTNILVWCLSAAIVCVVRTLSTVDTTVTGVPLNVLYIFLNVFAVPACVLGQDCQLSTERVCSFVSFFMSSKQLLLLMIFLCIISYNKKCSGELLLGVCYFFVQKWSPDSIAEQQKIVDQTGESTGQHSPLQTGAGS